MRHAERTNRRQKPNFTHRIAISNRRIRSFDGENVTFSWHDYADHNAEKTSELDAVEFLHRFLQHVLPPRFTRVRYYGFLANRDRAPVPTSSFWHRHHCLGKGSLARRKSRNECFILAREPRFLLFAGLRIASGNRRLNAPMFFL